MYYPIELDKIRNFRYGMKAISFIEKSLNKPITSIDLNKMTMEETAIFVLAGLRHEDDELTSDKIMDLIDEYSNIPAVVTAMSEALKQSFGSGEETSVEEETGEEGADPKNAKKAARNLA